MVHCRFSFECPQPVWSPQISVYQKMNCSELTSSQALIFSRLLDVSWVILIFQPFCHLCCLKAVSTCLSATILQWVWLLTWEWIFYLLQKPLDGSLMSKGYSFLCSCTILNPSMQRKVCVMIHSNWVKLFTVVLCFYRSQIEQRKRLFFTANKGTFLPLKQNVRVFFDPSTWGRQSWKCSNPSD